MWKSSKLQKRYLHPYLCSLLRTGRGGHWCRGSWDGCMGNAAPCSVHERAWVCANVMKNTFRMPILQWVRLSGCRTTTGPFQNLWKIGHMLGARRLPELMTAPVQPHQAFVGPLPTMVGHLQHSRGMVWTRIGFSMQQTFANKIGASYFEYPKGTFLAFTFSAITWWQ